jgi:hypothetical protein
MDSLLSVFAPSNSPILRSEIGTVHKSFVCAAGIMAWLLRCCCPPLVPEEYCRPGTLYSNPRVERRVDLRKLYKLIQQGKLAPLFPGGEDVEQPHPEHEAHLGIVQRVVKKCHPQTQSSVGNPDAALGSGMKGAAAAGVGSSCQHQLEACPICTLTYPALNRSRCCGKLICTECYLQACQMLFWL